MISTVDPDARHGHKTQARGFDGYKGHVAVDPDSEIITDTVVTPGNAGDASVAEDLIDDLLNGDDTAVTDEPKVFGDSAYGTGEFQQHLDDNDIASRCRTQPPSAPAGLFAKDRFRVDLDDDTVTCPAGVTVSIRRGVHGDGIAYFAENCATCELRGECTNATGGRTIRVNVFEAALAHAHANDKPIPTGKADYRANRPKVERKLAHLMRRRHGGRRARVRGRPKVDADFNLLAAAVNLARLAALGATLHAHRMGRHTMNDAPANAARTHPPATPPATPPRSHQRQATDQNTATFTREPPMTLTPPIPSSNAPRSTPAT